jgi:preprotein translocase subunit SecG
MWYTILVVLHIFSCFFLTAVVLLQTGKGSDIGAVFGGSSQTLFGSSGAGNLLTKLTTATAIIFMLTSLTLTYGTARETTKSVFDEAPVSAPAPTTPEEAPPAQPGASAEGQGATTAPAASEPAAPATTESAPAGTEQSPAPTAESTSK